MEKRYKMKINHQANFLNFSCDQLKTTERKFAQSERCTLHIQCHYLWHKVQELLLFADVQSAAPPVSRDAAIICFAKDMSH